MHRCHTHCSKGAEEDEWHARMLVWEAYSAKRKGRLTTLKRCCRGAYDIVRKYEPPEGEGPSLFMNDSSRIRLYSKVGALKCSVHELDTREGIRLLIKGARLARKSGNRDALTKARSSIRRFMRIRLRNSQSPHS